MLKNHIVLAQIERSTCLLPFKSIYLVYDEVFVLMQAFFQSVLTFNENKGSRDIQLFVFGFGRRKGFQNGFVFLFVLISGYSTYPSGCECRINRMEC